jgi:hypothetical protein
LIKTAHQHLLLLVGFDTLIYRKYYDTPPILVGHHQHFLLGFGADNKKNYVLCNPDFPRTYLLVMLER